MTDSNKQEIIPRPDGLMHTVLPWEQQIEAVVEEDSDGNDYYYSFIRLYHEDYSLLDLFNAANIDGNVRVKWRDGVLMFERIEEENNES